MAKKQVNSNPFDLKILSRVIGLARPFKRMFQICTVLSILLAILSPIRPILIQMTVDNHILAFGDGEEKMRGLLVMTIFMLVVLFVESILRYLFFYWSSWLGQSIIRSLRVRVYKHISAMRMKFFDRTPIGTAITRSISDVETINQIFSQGLIQMIADILTIIVVIAVMMSYSVGLTLVSLATLPLMIIATYLFQKAVKKSFQIVRNKVAELNAFAQEHITGMKIVQIFTAEKREAEKFEKINAGHKDAYIKSIWYYSIFFPVIEIISAAAIGLMIWYGANGVVAGKFEPGILISFILFINMIFRPMRQLADRFNTIQLGLVSADRVFQLLDEKEVIEDEGNKELEKVEGTIEFKNVWFAYNDDDYVIKDLSFSLKPGESMAIVGATGAGKSSIINVLSRFYEINKGEILIDGIDTREYSLESLRKRIGMVPQDVFLFSGSIRDNISLQDESISLERVQQSAKLVGADYFIQKLPGAYDYNVMERGVTLSMGQRQLISFIRAIVDRPQILILDEATSSIDTESELMVQAATEKLVEGRTSIVIAHRLSTIQKADKILVMDKGEMVEMGTHKALLKKGGFYSKLHEMQFSKGKAG